ncbi:MAG: GNAT family N-acetyltransferase, partial [Candidatus Eisenbacteria bacterium]
MAAPPEVTIRRYQPADRDTLAALLAAPLVCEQYDMFAGADGVERMLGDPYTPAHSVQLAFVGGEPAGFAYAVVLPGPPARWAVLRGAVLPEFRRRGLGRELHARVLAAVRQDGALAEHVISAWRPEPGAEALTTALGYVGE